MAAANPESNQDLLNKIFWRLKVIQMIFSAKKINDENYRVNYQNNEYEMYVANCFSTCSVILRLGNFLKK